MAVLLLAEVTDGELAMDATAKAVSAAKSLGDVTLLCAGASASAAGEAAARNSAMQSSTPGSQSMMRGRGGEVGTIDLSATGRARLYRRESACEMPGLIPAAAR